MEADMQILGDPGNRVTGKEICWVAVSLMLPGGNMESLEMII